MKIAECGAKTVPNSAFRVRSSRGGLPWSTTLRSDCGSGRFKILRFQKAGKVPTTIHDSMDHGLVFVGNRIEDDVRTNRDAAETGEIEFRTSSPEQGLVRKKLNAKINTIQDPVGQGFVNKGVIPPKFDQITARGLGERTSAIRHLAGGRPDLPDRLRCPWACAARFHVLITFDQVPAKRFKCRPTLRNRFLLRPPEVQFRLLFRGKIGNRRLDLRQCHAVNLRLCRQMRHPKSPVKRSRRNQLNSEWGLRNAEPKPSRTPRSDFRIRLSRLGRMPCGRDDRRLKPAAAIPDRFAVVQPHEPGHHLAESNPRHRPQ